MRVTIINSSPRAGKGSSTGLMMDAFAKGMMDAGADVETVNLFGKKINFCVGCMRCWSKTPGKCIHKDDMTREIFPKYIQSDLVVLATPIYHFTLNAVLKKFLERTMPMATPFWELMENGHPIHPLRYDKHPKIVFFATAAYPTEETLKPIKTYVRTIFREWFLFDFYRTASDIMTKQGKNGKLDEILDATFKGGQELIRTGQISENTMALMTQPITTFEKAIPIVNLRWKSIIREGVTPDEFAKQKLIPRPDSIATFIPIMMNYVRQEKIRHIHANVKYKFTGNVSGELGIGFEKGRMQLLNGKKMNYDLTIETPFETWMDVFTKKACVDDLVAQNVVNVSGDKALLSTMIDIFQD